MAAVFNLDGHYVLSALQKEFTESWPYLGVLFFSNEEWQKTLKGEPAKALPRNLTLAVARAAKSDRKAQKVVGKSRVDNSVKWINEHLGLRIPVCTMDTKGKYTYLCGEPTTKTLAVANREAEAAGCARFEYK